MTRAASLAPRLDRAALAGALVSVLQSGDWRHADVLLVDVDGRRVVLKDFARCARWVRATLGRLLVRRELRAYRALAGHPHVPRLVGVVDAHAFAIEYRPGRRLTRRLVGSLAPGFLEQLDAAVGAMHARGVVHVDLRHRDNVLVDARGEPVLIDFAAAVCVRPERALGRALLAALAPIDRGAVAKWRARLQPPASSEAGFAEGKGASSAARRGARRPT